MNKPDMAELDLDTLEKVNGGVIHMYVPIDKWEVIDDRTGGVLGTFDRPDLEAAKKYARELTKSEDVKDFLNRLPHEYVDENQLHAFIISGIKDYEDCLNLQVVILCT